MTSYLQYSGFLSLYALPQISQMSIT